MAQLARSLKLQNDAGASKFPEWSKRPVFSNPISQALQGMVNRWRTATNMETSPVSDKPRVDILYLGNESKVQIPRMAVTYWEQYELSYLCAAMSSAQIKLRDELLRTQGRFKPKWQRKCTICQTEYEHDAPRKVITGPDQIDPMSGMVLPGKSEEIEYCSSCRSSGTLVSANLDELSYTKRKFEEMNNAAQDLWDVLKIFEDDINITDDGWLVAICQYYYDKRFQTLYRKVSEIVRGHPNIMRIVSDGKGNRGGAFLSCPMHRDYVFNLGITTKAHKPFGYFDHYRGVVDWQSVPRTCPKCEMEHGRKVYLQDVWYVATEAGGQKPVAYFFKDEVLHISRYRPSLLYGVSPAVTLYREARSLIKMEEYIQEYFEKRMIPRGMVLIRRSQTAPAAGSPAVTPPPDAVKNFKSDINRRMQDNYHDIPFVGISHADDIQFVAFADKINEMEFIPVREEFKRNIASFYGLSPLFMAQTEESGGMNNESQQITVTNRALMSAQKIYNEKVFPWILNLFGVHNWKYELDKPERNDRISEIQERLAWAEWGSSMRDLGFRVIQWDETNLRLTISEKPDINLPSDSGGIGSVNKLGDESAGMSFKPPAPKTQDHEGSPTAQKRGSNP